MTKSTITREENIQAVFDLKAGYTLGLADVEILKRVARIALGAIDSEPVFNLLVSQAGYKGQKQGNNFGFTTLDAARELKEGKYLLYRHAQQPVVPDRSIFEKWWESQNGAPLDGWDSLRATDGYCDDGIDGQFEAWNAAMLAAAPQGVPDGK